MATVAEQKITINLTRSIVLIGLMGAGKTSVGKRLAGFLDVAFRDSDHEIEAGHDMAITEIFERFGEDYFRDGERKVIQRLLSETPGVLATGGGAFMAADIRAAIAQSGISVWLNADLDTLWDRVKDRTTRPLLQQAEPRRVLDDLLKQRRDTYAQATITVTSEKGISHDLMVRRILEAIRAYDLSRPDQDPILKKQVLT